MAQRTVENDPVVREIDVFLTKELMNDLKIIQYPNIPYCRSIGLPSAAKIRPHHQVLELTYPRAGDHFHRNQDVEEHLKLKQTKMISSKIPLQTHYALGIMSENQLHLTPVNSILQMRPNFEHLDSYAPEEEMIDDEEGKNEKESINKDSTREVEITGNFEQVGYKKKIPTSNKSEYDSYRQLKQQEILDEWVNLDVCVDEDENEKLYSKVGEDVFVKGDGQTYYQSLNYVQTTSQKAQSYSIVQTNKTNPILEPLPVLSLEILRDLSIEDQVKRILFTAHIVSFENIKDLISPSINNDLELIDALNNFSILVRGNFCLQSEFVYQDLKYRTLRDMIIIHIAEFGCVSKVQLEKKLMTPSSVIQEILETITELNRKKRRWECKVPDDIQFIRNFPQVIKFHNNKLDALKSSLSEIYNVLGEPECEILGPIDFGQI